MSYRTKDTMYAAAGVGSYYDRPGFHAEYATAGLGEYTESPGFDYEYATAGMGAYTDLPGFRDTYQYATAGLGVPESASETQINVRDLQEILMSKGFSVGRTGADNRWGPATAAALDRALGTGSSSDVSVSANVATLPSEFVPFLRGLPNRAITGGGSSSGGGGGSSEFTESDIPSKSPGDNINWDEIWPWAVGGGALVLVAGGLVFVGNRKRAMNVNRRRRRRRSSKRRSSRKRR